MPGWEKDNFKHRSSDYEQREHGQNESSWSGQFTGVLATIYQQAAELTGVSFKIAQQGEKFTLHTVWPRRIINVLPDYTGIEITFRSPDERVTYFTMRDNLEAAAKEEGLL